MNRGSTSEIATYTELLRRVDTTCKSRYYASTRLQWQHTLSQWTIAILSLALLIVPLLQLANVDLKFSATEINASQVLFAALVLVYALLIGTENFSRRAERFHRCGLELGRLSRQIQPYRDGEQKDPSAYDQLNQKYYDILEKYENHVRVDFLSTRLDLREHYYPKAFQYWTAYVMARVRYILVFSGHFVVMALVLGWVAVIVIR